MFYEVDSYKTKARSSNQLPFDLHAHPSGVPWVWVCTQGAEEMAEMERQINERVKTRARAACADYLGSCKALTGPCIETPVPPARLCNSQLTNRER